MHIRVQRVKNERGEKEREREEGGRGGEMKSSGKRRRAGWRSRIERRRAKRDEVDLQ